MLTTRILKAALVIAVVLATGNAAFAHEPSFTWQYRGGVVNPEQWIYDGDIPLAMFEQRLIEQPGENLLFFNGVEKPPLLRHLKLRPDGDPVIEGVQLYWVLIARQIITDRLVDINIDGQGTDRLEVEFITEDKHAIALSRRILTLTYDDAAGSYVWDFQCFLELKTPEVFNDRTVSFEFSDPWLVDCPGPAVAFQGMWGRRYRHFVFENDEGGLSKIPINHFTTSHKSGIRLRPDGVFAAVTEKDSNPAIQFPGPDAVKSGISICWWGYDLHLNRRITPDEMNDPVLARFRLIDLPEDKARSLERQAVMKDLGPDEWGGHREYPVYERRSDFAHGLALNGVYDGPVDPFPWKMTGEGALWDRTSGRNDTNSLKISRDKPGVTSWQTFQGDGEGYFAEPWTPCKGYRVSVWVKTESVRGNGTYLALQYHIPNTVQIHPIVSSEKITGSNGWTRLSLEVGPPPKETPDTGCLMLMLCQDGTGTTWFDDLEVEFLQ